VDEPHVRKTVIIPVAIILTITSVNHSIKLLAFSKKISALPMTTTSGNICHDLSLDTGVDHQKLSS
jgi:hypothetical protein